MEEYNIKKRMNKNEFNTKRLCLEKKYGRKRKNAISLSSPPILNFNKNFVIFYINLFLYISFIIFKSIT